VQVEVEGLEEDLLVVAVAAVADPEELRVDEAALAVAALVEEEAQAEDSAVVDSVAVVVQEEAREALLEAEEALEGVGDSHRKNARYNEVDGAAFRSFFWVNFF